MLRPLSAVRAAFLTLFGLVLAVPALARPTVQVREAGTPLVSGRSFNRAVLPMITVEGSAPLVVEILLDGRPFVSGTAVSDEGEHVLRVNAADAAGLQAALQVEFTVDLTPPVFEAVMPADGRVLAEPSLVVIGRVTGTVGLTLDGQELALSASGDFASLPLNLAEGPRSLTLVARDAAGNTTTRTLALVRDSLAPTLSVSTPAAEAVFGVPRVDVVGTVVDPQLESVLVNGVAASFQAGTYQALQVPLAEGRNLLRVVARDRAGNRTELQRAIVLDTRAPEVAIDDPAPGALVPESSLVVRGRALDSHLERVEVRVGNGAPLVATLDGASFQATVGLDAGRQTIEAAAFDRFGRVTRTTVEVERDAAALAIRLTEPAEGAVLTGATVTARGTVGAAEGLVVTVNGRPATVTGTTFEALGVPLNVGENTLLARARNAAGATGSHARRVERDEMAPRFQSSLPAAGSSGLGPAARFELLFDEAVAAPVGSWRLETAAGTAIPAHLDIFGATWVLVPAADLPAGSEIRLLLSGQIVDRAGTALANPQTLTFFSADLAGPAAPQVAALPAALCASSVQIAGTSEPDARIEVLGGAAAVQGRAGADGAFQLVVPLRLEARNGLELRARDREGNLGAAATFEVRHDCRPPTVVAAGRDGDALVVDFDEAIAPAGAAASTVVSDAGGALAGTVSVSGTRLRFEAPGLASRDLRLEIAETLRDLAGNGLATPFVQAFGAAMPTSFVAGTVIDDATGRPLAGAKVEVLRLNGQAPIEPRPTLTTGKNGRFQLPSFAGALELLISREGFSPSLRSVTLEVGEGQHVLAPRLTALEPAVSLGADGGNIGSGTAPRLAVPQNAFAAATAVRLTPLSEQGLPSRLPLGWSPRAALALELGTSQAPIVPALPLALELPVETPDGLTLVLVRLDPTGGTWRVQATAQVVAGRVAFEVTGGGFLAAVEADLGATAPPAAIVGAVLSAAPIDPNAEVLAASLTFAPATVLASQAATATAIFTLLGDLPSGSPLSLVVAEELRLLGGALRRESPYAADLVLYRAPDGTPRARFRLRPSESAQFLPIELGHEDVTLRLFPGDGVAGNVVGPGGGTVQNAEGDRIEIEAGALAGPAAVSLTRRMSAEMPLALPAGLLFLGALELDLGDSALSLPANLTWVSSLAPAPGASGLLLQAFEDGALLRWRVVAEIQATTTGWTTRGIVPADLPWPGVRQSGLYVFAQPTLALAFARGTVRNAAAAPVANVVVGTNAASWIQVNAADGRYALPVPLGEQTVVADAQGDGSRATATLAATQAEARYDLDLTLQLERPRILAVQPADGATNVLAGFEPTLLLSEPPLVSSLAAVRLFENGRELPIDLIAQGSLLRLAPRASLRPATRYEIRVTTALRDLDGHSLATAFRSSFTTRTDTGNAAVDLEQVFLIAPDTTGRSRLFGRPGALPAGALVFAENRSAFAATETVTVAPDGSFELFVDAQVGHNIVLHLVVSGQNEEIFDPGPFRSPDLRAAWVELGRDVRWVTGDGIALEAPEGAFQVPTWVRLDPQAVAPLAPVRASRRLLGFNLDFGGAEAFKRLEIAIPAPVDLNPQASLWLLRKVEALGKSGWMLHDVLRQEGDRLTTDFEMMGQGELVAGPRVGRGPQKAFEAAVAGPQSLLPGWNKKIYTPGATFPGQYQIDENGIFLGWFASPMTAPLELMWELAEEALIGVINGKLQSLLEADAILIPALLGQPMNLEIRDLTTGFKLVDLLVDPPAGAGQLNILPDTIYPTEDAVLPVGGSPLRFFELRAPGNDAEFELTRGIEASFTGLGPTSATGALTITGRALATAGEVGVTLIGLDDDEEAEVTTFSNGSFALGPLSVTRGRRYLLAVGAEVTTRQSLSLLFSDDLGGRFNGIEVEGPDGEELEPTIKAGPRPGEVLVAPDPAWSAGKTMTLKLLPELAAARGEAWDKTFEVAFRVEESKKLDQVELEQVRDVARLGSWLFVAAGNDGVAVLDARDPADLKNPIPGDKTFVWPFESQVHGIAVDPHARVWATGGGVEGPGLLRVYDPIALREALESGVSEYEDLKEAFWVGTTRVTDRLQGVGTQLPEGTPKQVVVLTKDDRHALLPGTPPAGITVGPTELPEGNDAFTVTVSGGAGSALSKAPITLRERNSGRFVRVDGQEDGSFNLSLEVKPPVALELLINRKTAVFINVPGVGLAVVDGGQVYRRDISEEGAFDPQSHVLTFYSGHFNGQRDSAIQHCNYQNADSFFGAALVDMASLFDFDNEPQKHHPLSFALLTNGFGALIVEANADDPTKLELVSQACLNLPESNSLARGLGRIQRYPFDFDGNGKFTAEEYRDYLLVGVGDGVMIVEVTDRENPRLVGFIPLDDSVGKMVVDAPNRRIYAAGFRKGLFVLAFDRPPTIGLEDANSDGVDDRLIETVELDGSTTASLLLVPELGLGFTGGLPQSGEFSNENPGFLHSLVLGPPRLVAVAPDPEGKLQVLDRLAPFGVPTAKASDDPEARDLPGLFRIMAFLPKVAEDEVEVDLRALTGPGGDMLAAGAPDEHEDLPRTRFVAGPGVGERGVTLKRLSNDPFTEGYSTFLSEREIAVVADLRAARHYERNEDEDDACTRCDIDDERANVPDLEPEEQQPLELLSGDQLEIGWPQELRTVLEPLYGLDRLNRGQPRVASVRWDISPAIRQEPALQPALGRGEAAPGTLLHSGEYSLAATDLFVKSRGFDFAFVRTYRSQTIGNSRFGPGFDFVYNRRLRQLPNGDVEFFDGTGRRDTFKLEGGEYVAPQGRFEELRKTTAGWLLIDSGHNTARFDGFGRLVALSDGTKDSEDSGNEMRFIHDAEKLVAILDTLERPYELSYDDDGRLERLKDFSGRDFEYDYDQGRLFETRTPLADLGGTSARLATRYAWEPGFGALAEVLQGRDNLRSLTDARGKTWLTLDYNDADGDGLAEEVVSQTWGEGSVDLDYSFEGGQTTVTDRRGHNWITRYDEDGHAIGYVDPAGHETTVAVDGEGRVINLQSPLGRGETFSYEESEQRRRGLNLVAPSSFADGRGGNGSSALLIKSVEFDERANAPTEVVDSFGITTSIERDDVGLPTRINRSGGSATQESTLEHNEWGQVIKVTEPDGRVTRYRYFEEEDSLGAEGSLKEVVVDDGRLALTSRFETDERGNVTALINARGVRHERFYNALDWLLQEVRASEGSSDGAPALSVSTSREYDKNGNVKTLIGPLGNRAHFTYGDLNELLNESLEVEVGGPTITRSFSYDDNLNLERITDANGEVESRTFDERGLVISISRGNLSAIESYDYDAEGNRIEYTNPLGFTWTYAYDGHGRLKSTTDPQGLETSALYDDGHNPTSSRSGEANGPALAKGKTTYDGLGRPKSREQSLFSQSSNEQQSWDYQYDAASRVQQVQDPEGRITQFEYDTAGRLIASLDPLGNRTVLELDPNGNATRTSLLEVGPAGATSTSSTAVFDALNRMKRAIDALGNVTEHNYDAAGRIVATIDPEGFVTGSQFDALGRLLRRAKPEGIVELFNYDGNGNLLSYADAFNQVSTYQYDDLNRLTRTQLPDGAVFNTVYDAAGNPIHATDANGTSVVATYNFAGQPMSRVVTPGPGIEGPVAEGFAYDLLGRNTEASVGPIVTNRGYDSLSRLVAETTLGQTVNRSYSLGDRLARIGYPSGLGLEHTWDAIGRLLEVEQVGASSSLASYQFQGPTMLHAQTLGNGLVRSVGYDLARRPIVDSWLSGDHQVLASNYAWSPRSLLVSAQRQDTPHASWLFAYDGAGRLKDAGRQVAMPVNNQSLTLSATPNGFSYTLDAAQNLIARKEYVDGIAQETALPRDPGGRNRPAALGNVTLLWDANGNLKRKGDLSFFWDYRNLLVRVEKDGVGTIATYDYDVDRRRVKKTVGSEVIETSWLGWKALEERRNGQLSARFAYGSGLDELLRIERDLDGNGTLEQVQFPLFDGKGNLVTLTGAAGQVLERYDYTPGGERTVLVDATPIVLEQVRQQGQRLIVELSEGLAPAVVAKAIQDGEIELRDAATNTAMPFTATQPVTTGEQAFRRLILEPAVAPTAGTSLVLELEAPALVDSFGNVPSASFSHSFTWANDQILVDSTPPRIEKLLIDQGRVIVELSEEVSAATTAITIDGAALTLALDTTGYRLESTTALATGAHTLRVETTLVDLAGLALATAEERNFTLAEETTSLSLYDRPDPREVVSSTTGNLFGFHGRPVDPETGLIYFRNRYYDPEMGRFVSADPLGYVDGPSMYAFAVNDPVNGRDPLGLVRVEVGHTYTATGYIDGKFVVYDGSAVDVKKRLVAEHGYEKWKEFIRAETTKVVTRRVTADLNTDGRTLRSATVQALRGPEEINRQKSAEMVEEMKQAGQDAESVNKARAAKDPQVFIERHKVEVGPATPYKVPRARVPKGNVFADIWDAFMYARERAIDKGMAKYVSGDYEFEDRDGVFKVIQEEQAGRGLFGFFRTKTTYRKEYASDSRKVYISEEEYNGLADEAEALYGRVDQRNFEFVPGLLRPTLPKMTCETDPNCA